MEERPRKKSLSPKLQLKRIIAMLPVELHDWLKEKAKRENKSLSYVLTELLTEIREREKANGQA